MIDRLTFKAGGGSNASKLSIVPPKITVFIGPNNSGKSRALREISGLGLAQTTYPPLVTENINFRGLSAPEAEKHVESLTVKGAVPRAELHDHVVVQVGANAYPETVFRPSLIQWLVAPNENEVNRNNFVRLWMGSRVRVLDGFNRLGLSNEQEFGDLQLAATTSFQILFRNDTLRTRFQKIVFDAIGSYPVLDPTKGGKLRLRLSETKPSSVEIERGLSDLSLSFYGAALPIENASDGVKAFVGILAEVMAGDPVLLIVDEPEAFLHPSLAFKLGLELGRLLAGVEKQMFASTHSSSFLMGCIQSNLPLNVVRLTHLNGRPSAILLNTNDLNGLNRNPLLKSLRLLDALFFEYVIVTEGGSDTAFYNEINERLISVGRGLQNCLFISGIGKQSVAEILKPLRSMGIPTAAIYDFDVVNMGGPDGGKMLDALRIPDALKPPMSQTRASIKSALDVEKKSLQTQGGLKLLNGGILETAETFLDQLARYGGFVVEVGQLEDWLMSDELKAEKSRWLGLIFARMGDDPTTTHFMQPAADDVWAFLDRVAGWLRDPDRKGVLPSA